MTLEENIRHYIGESGPQLPEDEYEARIDEMLNDMTAKELLHWISMILEDERIMKDVG